MTRLFVEQPLACPGSAKNLLHVTCYSTVNMTQKSIKKHIVKLIKANQIGIGGLNKLASLIVEELGDSRLDPAHPGLLL